MNNTLRRVQCAGHDEDYLPCEAIVRTRREGPAFCPEHAPVRLQRVHRGKVFGERVRLQVLIPPDLNQWLHNEAERTGLSLNVLATKLLEAGRTLRDQNYTNDLNIPRSGSGAIRISPDIAKWISFNDVNPEAWNGGKANPGGSESEE